MWLGDTTDVNPLLKITYKQSLKFVYCAMCQKRSLDIRAVNLMPNS